GLRRRDGHDKYDEHLSERTTVQLRQRDEAQIDRVEHQLHGHEDDERVAPSEHADDADREQHRTVEQGLGDHARTLRLARTTAPTIATSSSTLVSSNASRWSVNRTCATGATALGT